MYSILVVNTPAPSYDLTTLAAVKSELGITDTSEDTTITAWITQASQAAASYCDRIFPTETVTETFRDIRCDYHASLLLARSPVVSISSVVEDGATLVAGTDYECDLATGTLYRLDSNTGAMCRWRFQSLIVAYVGGYASIPVVIGRAAITLVKLLRANATRDPAIRSENILSGLYSYTLFNPSTDFSSGLPVDVEALLAPYRIVGV